MKMFRHAFVKAIASKLSGRSTSGNNVRLPLRVPPKVSSTSVSLPPQPQTWPQPSLNSPGVTPCSPPAACPPVTHGPLFKQVTPPPEYQENAGSPNYPDPEGLIIEELENETVQNDKPYYGEGQEVYLNNDQNLDQDEFLGEGKDQNNYPKDDLNQSGYPGKHESLEQYPIYNDQDQNKYKGDDQNQDENPDREKKKVKYPEYNDQINDLDQIKNSENN